MAYVATSNDQCVGYCWWTQKSGFRPEVVLELEQIAVAPEFQGEGIGARLITESLHDVRSVLAMHDSVLKHVMVTTRADDQAQRLYASILGAEVKALVPDLYSYDEVVMIARNVAQVGHPQRGRQHSSHWPSDHRDQPRTLINH